MSSGNSREAASETAVARAAHRYPKQPPLHYLADNGFAGLGLGANRISKKALGVNGGIEQRRFIQVAHVSECNPQVPLQHDEMPMLRPTP